MFSIQKGQEADHVEADTVRAVHIGTLGRSTAFLVLGRPERPSPYWPATPCSEDDINTMISQGHQPSEPHHTARETQHGKAAAMDWHLHEMTPGTSECD